MRLDTVFPDAAVRVPPRRGPAVAVVQGIDRDGAPEKESLRRLRGEAGPEPRQVPGAATFSLAANELAKGATTRNQFRPNPKEYGIILIGNPRPDWRRDATDSISSWQNDDLLLRQKELWLLFSTLCYPQTEWTIL